MGAPPIPEIEDDERLAWVVADEGKGVDLVLEVLHSGDRKKDLVTNVERYAQLKIPEYFVFDRARQQLHGYRLPGPEATRYERIVPQGGRYRSEVLRLELTILNGRLRFYDGLRETLVALLEARGMACPEEAHARVFAMQDPATLQQWLLRAATARTPQGVFAE